LLPNFYQESIFTTNSIIVT